jgi:hypothetical protein
MALMTIAEAWNQTSAFVRREARLLFPLAFVMVAIPQAMVQSLSGGAAAPGQAAAEASPLMPVLLLPLLAVTMIGNLAISFLALRPGATVGEALRVGARRFLPLFGAVLLIALPLAAVAIVIALAIGVGGDSGTLSPRDSLFVLTFLLAMVVIGVRLLLVTPLAATGAGPVEMLGRSWRLTGPVFWKLLGFLILAIVVFLVLTLAITAVGGLLIILIAGVPQPGSIASFLVLLLNAALQTLFTVYIMTAIAHIYLLLTDDRARETPGV